MPIPITGLHADRVVSQIKTLITNMQGAFVDNANAHKSMALAQSPPLGDLITYVNDTANAYLKLLSQVDAATDNPKVKDVLFTLGVTSEELEELVTELRRIATRLYDYPKLSYKNIIDACDEILEEVEKPLSVWEE